VCNKEEEEEEEQRDSNTHTPTHLIEKIIQIFFAEHKFDFSLKLFGKQENHSIDMTVSNMNTMKKLQISPFHLTKFIQI